MAHDQHFVASGLCSSLNVGNLDFFLICIKMHNNCFSNIIKLLSVNFSEHDRIEAFLIN